MREIGYFYRNRYLLADGKGKRPLSNEHAVNVNWWHIRYDDIYQNFGDMLAPVIVKKMCDMRGIDCNSYLDHGKHLYSIGSILFFENQDAVVWGTGSLSYLNRNINNILHQKFMRKLDVRAVRGPKTRDNLLRMGIKCPKIYGDPAMLLPLFYFPKKNKKYQTLIISHIQDNPQFFGGEGIKHIVARTDSWTKIVDLILESERVVSSSLHGIILAESYGVPAILLKSESVKSLFKYEDYYLGTGRENFAIASSIEEGIGMTYSHQEIENIEAIQNRLISAFPSDIWMK